MLRALILAAVALSGCAAENPDAELRELIAAMEEAVEARDTGFFRGVIADSYRDTRGNDRQRLIDAIRGFFLTNPRIEAVVRVSEVRLDGAASAEVVVQVALLRESGGASLLGFEGDLSTVELEFLRDGDWKLIGAEWE